MKRVKDKISKLKESVKDGTSMFKGSLHGDHSTAHVPLPPVEAETQSNAPAQSTEQRGQVPLRLLSSPENEAEANVDIIAIHGLDTKSPDTWIYKHQDANRSRHNDNSRVSEVDWLADPEMLPAKVGPARIFTCDWPARLFVDKDTIQMTTEELARGLLLSIQSGRPKGKDRPILFIASCLGGIILIQALVIAATQNSDYHSLWRATRGIVFLATPFRGTAFQDIAELAVPLLKGWAKLKGQSVTELLGSVKEPPNFLQELIAKFTNEYQRCGQICELAIFYEKKKTNLVQKGVPSPSLADMLKEPKLLVDRSSACLDIVLNPIGLNRSHVLMNKFSGSDDKDYCAVTGRIELILEQIRTNSVLEKADAWIRQKHYAAQRLKIERISGETLAMDQCYINLAMVEYTADVSPHSKDKDIAPQSSPFSLAARLKIETLDRRLEVTLPALFDPRKKRDGSRSSPRRIFIRGRAGVGKTTLCKKIVHDFTYRNMWQGLFNRVLWVPLRRLKQREYSEYNFQSLFLHIYFEQHPDRGQLAQELWCTVDAESGGTLFILDGLDEVFDLLDSRHPASSFLTTLLNYPNVIITSRPHAARANCLENLDLDLETIGFNPQQVKDYLEKTIGDKQKVDSIQSFLKEHSLIQGLVRIPIQLDALCFTWDDGYAQGSTPQTMTAVYEAIVHKLWGKDILRLEKKVDGMLVTEDEVRNFDSSVIKELVDDGIKLLEAFGFAGLCNDVIDFEPNHQAKLAKLNAKSLLLDRTLPHLSFLRTSDPSSKHNQRSYHFLHLTFQEYFAAQYFVRQWKSGESLICVDLDSHKPGQEIKPADFLQTHKYSVRYDIFWRFVVGLLSVEGEKTLFEFFKIVEEEPLDLLGPTHQRLVMHCLSEVASRNERTYFGLLRARLEERLLNWLLFECRLSQDVFLARESEFPENTLLTALKNSTHLQRLKILKALAFRASLPDTAINILTELLQDKDKQVRSSAAEALLNQNLPEATINILTGLLQDKDEQVQVRYSAAQALANQSLPKATINILIELLQDKDWEVRDAAAQALAKQNLPEATINILIGLLQDKDWEVRSSAAEALLNQNLPEATINILIGLLQDKDREVRSSAAQALAKQNLPEATINILIGLLQDKDNQVRDAAAQALANQSSLPEATINILIGLLQDKDWQVRDAAAQALANQSLPEATINILIGLLQDKDWQVRDAAAQALANQSLPEATINILIGLLQKDKDNQVRDAAAWALAKQSSLPEATINILTGLLQKDKDNQVRDAAARALAKQSSLPEATINILTGLLQKDKDWQVRYSAARALAKQSSLPEATINILIGLLQKDKDEQVRDAAAEALTNQSNKMVESIGFVHLKRLETTILIFHNNGFIKLLYQVLLWRSFREQLSWSIIPQADTRNCILDMQGGLKEAAFKDQGEYNLFLDIVSNTRDALDIDGYKLWDRVTGT